MTVAAPILTMLEESHSYQLDGRPIVNVTRVLDDLRLNPPYPLDRGQLAFGKATHRGCELAIQDRLDLAKTSPVLAPYVRGFLEKAREMRMKLIASELRVYEGHQHYAGTLDLWVEIYDGDQAVIDLKTGVPPRCVELQTAGYVDALTWMSRQGLLSHPVRTPRRFSMQLTPDRAIVRECRDPYDYHAWRGAVALYKWKAEKRNG